MVNALNSKLSKGTILIHKYTGNEYYFYKASLHTETEEAMINYEDNLGNLFSRPAVHFFSKEFTSDGEIQDRFEIRDYLGADPKMIAKWVEELLILSGLPLKI